MVHFCKDCRHLAISRSYSIVCLAGPPSPGREELCSEANPKADCQRFDGPIEKTSMGRFLGPIED
jgi:hypothetical protein